MAGISGLRAILVAALAVLVSACAASSAGRGVSVTLRTDETPTGKITLYSASRALVIGIDNYTQGWPRLQNVVADARLVAHELKRRGFEVSLRTDLTGLELQQTLKEFFALQGTDPETRLLLWFAGHGYTVGGEGFIVPADAPTATDPRFKVKALPMRDFGTLVRLADSKHVLSVFDSCFSGTVFASRSGAAPAAITQKTAEPVRQFLTSGDAGQSVRDDGAFRDLFIRAIRGEETADVNDDGYVTGDELGLFLSQRVASLTAAAQTPRYGKLHDVRFDRGDFVFVLPGSEAVSSTRTAMVKSAQSVDHELAFWKSVEQADDAKAYEAYLRKYPNGDFADLARLKLEAPADEAYRMPPPLPQRMASRPPPPPRQLNRSLRLLQGVWENRAKGVTFQLRGERAQLFKNRKMAEAGLVRAQGDQLYIVGAGIRKNRMTLTLNGARLMLKRGGESIALTRARRPR
ncbi:MAG: hypothetical protein HN403_09385 [Rhodospirillales bacterium]|jgi:uncharacterized caspase-like protein|nr:hypothetical protein [Rhodospirillales bacterium]